MDEPKRPLRFSTVLNEAKQIIWTRRKRLGLGLLLMVIGRAAGFVVPFLIKYVLDEVLPNGNRAMMTPIALIACGAVVIDAATGFLLARVLSVSAQKAIHEMRRRVQSHIGRLPVGFFDSTRTGMLISRVMTDAEGIRNLVGTGLVHLIGGLLTSSVALGILFYLNWRLTLIVLIIVIVFGVSLAWAFSRLRPIFRERGKFMAEASGRLAENFGGIRTVKAYTAEKHEELAFTRGANKIFRSVATSITVIAGFGALTTLLFGLAGIALTVIGVNLILNDTLTIGTFVVYVYMLGLVAAPMLGIANISTQLSEAFAGLDRIREVLALPTEAEEDIGREPLGSAEGDVEFDDVCFEYNEGEPVLKHVSFTAPAGTTTALVGPSGSGKSTLISLVMAFIRPGSGRVTIDGRDLESIRLLDYRSLLGVVLQENFLFDGTIAENIAYSRRSAAREEIEEAARIAHCDEFIDRFEDGYDTIVGERGVKLSGGQRQRIGIARAILADPRLLILDEATSSLDSESEAMIQDGLASLREGRTTFVIAHRLSTIQSADQILVVEGGEIVERGTHDQLLALAGRYKQLYDKQYRLATNQFINPGEDFTPDPDKTERGPGAGGAPGNL